MRQILNSNKTGKPLVQSFVAQLRNKYPCRGRCK